MFCFAVRGGLCSHCSAPTSVCVRDPGNLTDRTAGADFGREAQSADAWPHAYDCERQLELE